MSILAKLCLTRSIKKFEVQQLGEGELVSPTMNISVFNYVEGNESSKFNYFVNVTADDQ